MSVDVGKKKLSTVHGCLKEIPSSLCILVYMNPITMNVPFMGFF